MSPTPCRLSVVVTSRNDDHGGDMLRRFAIFADGLVEQAQRHGLPGELIVVEWNPPPGPGLREALHLRSKWEGFPIRWIAVPHELHAGRPHAEAIPLFQMMAKNVGIRRARGRFVLSTNPDLLFNDALFRSIASPDLDPEALHRVDRSDVGNDVPVDASLDDQLAWCADHVLRVHTRWGSFESPQAGRERSLPGLVLEFAGQRASHRMARGGRAASLLQLAAKALGVARSRVRSLALPRVHTNGCGDFTLLARDAWQRLRGYPEVHLWSMHLDALLCFMAVAAGYEQRLLGPPARLYHVEHGGSWAALDVPERIRAFERRPWIDPTVVEELWEQMYWERRTFVVNGPDWGLAEHDLPERET